jgi:UTP--glucose-1-phosphate uridylyltransferase
VIQKALVPIAGKGARLMPVTSVVPKAMFPIVQSGNTVRCFLHLILEQIISAGIEHVGIVSSAEQTNMLKHYFESVLEGGYGRLPAHIKYITQPSPDGFGDAVLRAASFVGDDSFLLLLGDHIYIEEDGRLPCTAQVAGAFESSTGVAMIGVQQVSASELSKVGVAGGTKIKGDIYLCKSFVEKPDLKTARQKLVTDGLSEGTYLAHCGIYVFTAEIFDCLARVAEAAQGMRKEVELAEAQSLLLEKYPKRYFLCEIAGRAYDIGVPRGYADAQIAFQSKEWPGGLNDILAIA